MGKINWTRVILGGIVAGVIINIFEFVLNGVVLAKDMEAAISALGRQMGGSQLAMSGLGPRVSADGSDTARAEAFPDSSHGHWPGGGAGRGYRRNACRRLALPRRDRLIARTIA